MYQKLRTWSLIIGAPPPPPPTQVTSINGQPVEVVGSYKYLGSIIDDRLNFTLNTENICKKGQQRLFCLRKMAKFNVDKTIMRLFYKSYIESVLSFSIFYLIFMDVMQGCLTACPYTALIICMYVFFTHWVPPVVCHLVLFVLCCLLVSCCKPNRP